MNIFDPLDADVAKKRQHKDDDHRDNESEPHELVGQTESASAHRGTSPQYRRPAAHASVRLIVQSPHANLDYKMLSNLERK
jgi:hypothetical protein